MYHTGGHSYGHSIITVENAGEKAVHMGIFFLQSHIKIHCG